MKLFDEIPYLENETIFLKKIEEKDSDVLIEMTLDDDVNKYLPANLFEYGFTDKKEAIRAMYEDLFQERKGLFLGIYPKSESTMAGLVEIYNYDAEWSKASIGVRLNKKLWNKGLAEQAMKLALSYLWEKTDIRRVTAHAMTDNIYSCRALEKCGFRMRKMNFYEDWGHEKLVCVNKYITEKFEHVNYACFGNGPKTLVILPGVALVSTVRSADVIADHFSAFKDYTIYLLDDRDGVNEGYSIVNRAGDVAALMKTLKIKDACVFATSMGGMVGQILAAEHPDLVKKMVLASTSAKTYPHTVALLERWIQLAKEESLETLIRTMNDDIYSEAMVSQFGDFMVKNVGPVSEEELKKFIILVKAIENYDGTSKSDCVKCPVYVIGSEGDLIFTKEEIQNLAKKTGAKIKMYGPEYGHGVYDEAPDFKQQLLDFFAE